MPAEILDLPAGTGRNSDPLARLGHRLTIADIDASLVRDTKARLRASGAHCEGVVADAGMPLPFAPSRFDLILIIDFVDEHLLATIARTLKPGGHLIHESYSARGENWRQLLPQGRTMKLIAPMLDPILFETRPAGPTGTEAETVKILARRPLL